MADIGGLRSPLAADERARALITWSLGQGWSLVEFVWALGIVLQRLSVAGLGVDELDGQAFDAWEESIRPLSKRFSSEALSSPGGAWGWLGSVGMIVNGIAYDLEAGHDLGGR